MRSERPKSGLMLLVSPDSAYRRSAEECLAAEGHRVLSVASTADAMAAVESAIPDVLVIDLAAGTALTRDALIRATRDRDGAVGVVLTADGVGEVVLVQALRQRLDDYVPKSSPWADLAASVADALGAATDRRRILHQMEDTRRVLRERDAVPLHPALEGARALAVDLIAEVEAARGVACSAAVDPAARSPDDLRGVLVRVASALSCIAARLDCLRPPRPAPGVRASVPYAITSAASACQGCRDTSRVELRVDVEGALPRVRCPQPTLERILVGALCFSASEASCRDDGVVTVTAREARGGVTIAIADNGRGATPSNVVSQAARFRPGQTGSVPLMLLVCAAGTCEAVGGAVLVRAKASIGTTVTVSLPADPDSPRDYPGPNGPAWRRTGDGTAD